MEAHSFNPSTQGGIGRRISVCSRPAWSIDLVLGQPVINREPLSKVKKSYFNFETKSELIIIIRFQ